MFAFRWPSATPMTTRRWPIRSCSGFVLWGYGSGTTRHRTGQRMDAGYRRRALRGRRVRGDDHAGRSRLQECQERDQGRSELGKPFLAVHLSRRHSCLWACNCRWVMSRPSCAGKWTTVPMRVNWVGRWPATPRPGMRRLPPDRQPPSPMPAPQRRPSPRRPRSRRHTWPAPLPAIPTRSSGWRSARTGGCCPPPATTTRRGCGTRPPATACARVRLLALSPQSHCLCSGNRETHHPAEGSP
jgi:hypothetical protein